ncbi:hypothetical protein D3C81_1078350 [compost metagenome]
MFAIMLFEDHRHPSPLKIKWNLVNFQILILHFQVIVQFGMFQHSLIHQILETSLMKTIEIGPFEHLIIFDPIHIKMFFHDDLVQCQRSCFVGAQNIHGTYILDRI